MKAKRRKIPVRAHERSMPMPPMPLPPPEGVGPPMSEPPMDMPMPMSEPPMAGMTPQLDRGARPAVFREHNQRRPFA